MQKTQEWIIGPPDPVLVTGANGFIGAKVAETLFQRGFKNIRGLVRSARDSGAIREIAAAGNGAVQLVEGNLLSRESCAEAVKGVKMIIHLAANADKSYSGSFFNTVIPTRNLIEAALADGNLRRLVNVSSFAVYSNWDLSRGKVLDETCPVETGPDYRFETYCYAKAKQDELVAGYVKNRNLQVVTVRPGAVFGPRSRQFLTPRIGIDTFGIYLHLGGGNPIPLTFVDNCAEAMVLAGLVKGIDGEVINIVDDDLPTAREFLGQYKRNVAPFRSIYVPYPLFYLFSHMWERYSERSREQFPPVFNRRRAAAYWKGNKYSNAKAKRLLGWTPRVSMAEGSRRHFEYFKNLQTQKKS